MANVILIADMITVTKAGSVVDFWQPLEQVLDIGEYDTLDLQFGLVGLKGTSATGITVKLYTSMFNLSDDVSTTGTWSLVATVPLAGATGTPEWATKGVATTPALPLLRYLRWRCELLTNSDAATFTILGLARPR